VTETVAADTAADTAEATSLRHGHVRCCTVLRAPDSMPLVCVCVCVKIIVCECVCARERERERERESVCMRAHTALQEGRRLSHA
jgi:hypothetical protein